MDKGGTVLMSEEAELGVIGSVLMSSGKALEELTLTPDMFSSPRNGAAYGLLQSLWAKGRAVDVTTAFAAVQTAPPETKRLIDAAYWSTAMSASATSAMAGEYQRIVKDGATRRNLLHVAGQITQAVQDVEDLDHVIETARAAIDSAGSIDSQELQPMSVTVEDTIKGMHEPARFIPTPWADLNHLIGGWRPGALYVIGARPGSGKTLMGLQAAISMVGRGSVLMCTLEMSQAEIHKRVFSQLMHIPLTNILDSNMTPQEWERLENRKAEGWERFYVDDNPSATVESIRRNARSINRKQPLSAIVVDYLQLMEHAGKSDKKRHELIGQWTRQLKIMSKKFDVPVLILSQLNRDSTKAGLPPTLADLRESGSIEQDADVVLLLHRDDNQPADLNVLVAKNRHGMREAIRLDWNGAFANVSDKGFTPNY